MREIGIGQETGNFTYNGTTYRSSMLNKKFAMPGSDVFVTGVAYHDTDANDFYSIREADAGIWLAIDGHRGAAAVGGYRVDVSVNTTLAAGIAGGQLLESAALKLTGSNAGN